MRFSRLSLLPAGLLASLARADSHAGKNFNVTVGKGGLKFDPEIITANKGDTITYFFYARNHSVVQSSFDDPCHPLAGDGSIFSAFVPNPSADIASATTFTITLNDTKPIWLYCSQTNGDHCQKGMVQSINAPSSGNTHEAYKKKAETASTSTSPPGGPPGGIPRGGLRSIQIEVAPGEASNLVFSPNNMTEPPGTVLKFNFNPANHSVVQSSFDKPCEPLKDGFSSGFIPTQSRPSGVSYHVEVTDTKPIWFYCAQTTRTHCQAGMVGSVNAPLQGNTLEAFVAKAKEAPASTIPPKAPLGGVVTVNGTNVATFNGNVLDLQSLSVNKGVITHVPKPGENTSDTISRLAGGSQPLSYNWSPQISDNATEYLQLVAVLDNVLLEVLWDGFDRLKRGGQWAGMYPRAIVSTIGSMAAQALVHRSTSTDSLQHFGKKVLGACVVAAPGSNLDDWLQATQTLILLQIGVLIDVITLTSASDPWIVPALATQIGAKSRMSAVLNMMQNHKAAAAPREALLPARLGHSYVMQRFVRSCPDALEGVIGGQKVLPPLEFKEKKTLGVPGTVTAVTVAIPAGTPEGELYVAWIGAWGGLQFTPVRRSDGFANVPSDMYGHLWAVLTSRQGVKLQEVAGVAIAGPEPIWVADPTWSDS